MTKLKVVLSLLLITILFAFTACSGSATPTTEPAATADSGSQTEAPTAVPAEPAADTGVTLGISLSTLNNPFFVSLKEGAEAAAADAGVKLIVVDAQDDPAKEATNIEDLIQKGVNALLINPTDSDAIVPSIQKANQAGIPVFTIDRAHPVAMWSAILLLIMLRVVLWLPNSCVTRLVAPETLSSWKA